MPRPVYDEETLVRPEDGAGAYGQDGFGWYVEAKHAADYPK